MPGRVLSAANENKIRAAFDALKSILGLLEDDSDDDEDTKQDPEQEPRRESMGEAAILEAEFMPLVERALRPDGTIPVKIIAPGWGSSGYYPAEVLERDGPQVFRAGTQMLWDHPTAREEMERPEGSLHNLAAELVSDARYLEGGPAGPGLYADARVFGAYRAAVDELAPHIGVSIRASGRAVQGEADGRRGPIIQELTAARTVDFVTQAGAGGKIVEMFEAARPSRQTVTREDKSVDTKELQEAVQRLEQDNARMREALLLRDAREFVRQEVETASVPDVTKERLVERLSANPPSRDGELDTDAYRTQIAEAVQDEQAYLAAAIPSGRVAGMGGAPEPRREDEEKRLMDAFARLGVK